MPSAWFVHGEHVSEDFEVYSPLMFNVVLGSIIRRVNDDSTGIQWTFHTSLTNLEYVDDIFLKLHMLNKLDL